MPLSRVAVMHCKAFPLIPHRCGGASQANSACPLQCTSNSPAGCCQRFQCWDGCPACLPPPQAPLCSGFKQVTCTTNPESLVP